MALQPVDPFYCSNVISNVHVFGHIYIAYYSCLTNETKHLNIGLFLTVQPPVLITWSCLVDSCSPVSFIII